MGGCFLYNIESELKNTDVLFELAEVFKTFGDSTRIRILSMLFEGQKCVQDLSDSLNMGQSAVSHQLRYLRTAGLVKVRRDGKNAFYSLDDKHVRDIIGIGLKHVLHLRGGHDNV